MKKISLILLLILAIAACKEKKTAISSKKTLPVEKSLNETPNIILILADDLGKGLLSKNGQEIITTPNIDKLAKEGISFGNAYTNMLCAPSRASLITGLHDSHANKFDIISPSETWLHYMFNQQHVYPMAQLYIAAMAAQNLS